MNATDKEKIDMNTAVTTNQRLVTILLILLIILVALLVIGIVVVILMMSGRMMMGMGSMTLAPGASAGVNGGMMNDMYTACINMMQNFQSP